RADDQTTPLRDLFIALNDATNPYIGNGRAIRIELNHGAPTAVANGPYAVAAGGSVPLSAAGTADPDEPAAGLTYLWDFDGDGVFGETGTAAVRGNEVGPTPPFLAADMGSGQTVTVGVRVIDRGGPMGTPPATVTVPPAAVQ